MQSRRNGNNMSRQNRSRRNWDTSCVRVYVCTCVRVYVHARIAIVHILLKPYMGRLLVWDY